MNMNIDVLFVGQAPSSLLRGQALSGDSGIVLAGLLGMTLKEFLAKYPRANLNQRHAGKQSAGAKGDAFDVHEGMTAAGEIMRLTPRRIVMLGQKVALCFAANPDPLTITATRDTCYLALPHPSGINRWWNSPANRFAAARGLQTFLR